MRRWIRYVAYVGGTGPIGVAREGPLSAQQRLSHVVIPLAAYVDSGGPLRALCRRAWLDRRYRALHLIPAAGTG